MIARNNATLFVTSALVKAGKFSSITHARRADGRVPSPLDRPLRTIPLCLVGVARRLFVKPLVK